MENSFIYFTYKDDNTDVFLKVGKSVVVESFDNTVIIYSNEISPRNFTKKLESISTKEGFYMNQKDYDDKFSSIIERKIKK